MYGYDRKKLIMSHDSVETVAFDVEVIFNRAGWHVYERIDVPAGKTHIHRFPDGYSAHWVRLRAGKDCRATALFIYE
jgi:hypothetical protein